VATQENVKKLEGTLGWGLVGGALLGPAGLPAGMLVGGQKTKITFMVRFRNGQKLLAQGDADVFSAIQAAAFDAPTDHRNRGEINDSRPIELLPINQEEDVSEYMAISPYENKAHPRRHYGRARGSRRAARGDLCQPANFLIQALRAET
jgi:hypothetical protein